MGRPQSAWAKFRLLMWKNWTLQKRHKVQAVMEVLLPLIFTSLLVLIRALTDATVYPEPTLYAPLTVDHLPTPGVSKVAGMEPKKLLEVLRTTFPDGVPEEFEDRLKEFAGPFADLAAGGLINMPGDTRNRTQWVGFTPNNTFVTGLMADLQDRLGGPQHVSIRGFPTETELLKFLDPPIEGQILQLNADNKRIAGIVMPPDITNLTDFTKDISFKIRPRISSTVTAFEPPAVWYTSLQYPPFQMLGPRNKGDNDGGSPGYYEHGFLSLQHTLSAVITARLSGQSVDPPAFAQRVPYPGYVDDQFLVVLQGWLPLVIMLSFIYPAINIVKNVVVEKEKRLKESMKMMGMPNWIHWMAWWSKSFIQLFVSICIMTMLVVIDWYAGPEGEAVLSQSDPSVVFVYLLLYTITSIAFCFMISTFFSKANSAATAAGVLFFVLFIPYNFMYLSYQTLTLSTKIGGCIMSNTAMGFGGMLIAMWEGTANIASTVSGLMWFGTDIPYRVMWRRLDTLTLAQKVLCCFLSNTNMGMGGKIIAQYESAGEGIQWSNVNRGVSPDDEFKMSHVFMMFVVDTVLYLLVTWYVEAVFPGEYGISQRWYFLFTKRYWLGSKPHDDETVPVNNNTERADFFEAEPTNAKAGISIKQLSKKFPNGKLAVNNVSLNMYEGQITALLGHNGAGKTTTMSVLVGLFPATSGTALINGYDINTEVDEVRASLGICPQHDVLFDELTVAEHIRFFCMLKGFDGDYRAEIDKMLTTLQLEDKRHAQSHTLSGGMKRKLSVGVALCGDSKVVLLDEPTSGMDPSARRSTWDLLQRERSGRTLLLTTHFMEEADLLGDSIAIMADGQIQCSGSSMFLKRKYGAGYHLVIVKEEGCNVDKITNTIQRFIPDITYDQNIGAELSYVLPNEASAKFEEMFTVLDESREELKVSSYGASITTMEEVFIRVGEQSNPKVQEELQQRSKVQNGDSASRQTTPHGHENGNFLADVETIEEGGGGGRTTQKAHPTLADIGSVRYLGDEEIEMVHRITIEKVPQERRNTSGGTLFIQQFYAMLVKKAIYSFRNWILTLVQIFLPIFFLSMALLVIMSFPGLADDPPLELQLKNYAGSDTPVWAAPGVPEAAEIAAFARTIEDTTVEVIDTTEYDNMTQYLLEKSEENIPGFNQHYMAAVDLHTDGGPDLQATAFFNNQPYHAAGVAINVLDETLMRYYTNDSSYRIRVTNHPTPISDQTKLQMQLNGQSNGFNIAFNVAFGVSFLAASFVLFLVKEMVTKAKHLQFVSGVGITVFWLSNLVWDYLSYLIPACGMLLTLLAFQEEGFIEAETQGALLLLFVLYGYAMLPQTYLFSFAFTVPSSGFTRVALFNIFTGMATMVTVSVMRIPLLELIDVADILDWIFLILPNYALGMGMADIYSNYQGNQYCSAIPKRKAVCEFLNVFNATNACCKELENCGPSGCVYFTDSYLAMQRLGIGRTLLFLFAEGTLCLIILCLIELRTFDRIKYYFNNKRNTYGKLIQQTDEDEESAIVAEVDSDVAAEKERIHNTDMTALKTDNVLVVKDLTKFYSNDFLAVNRLCLAVPKGECFGLLGVNGAGKTTTFKMLTGDELISWGDAFLMSRSVRSEVKEVHKKLGYCPQFYAVIDQMTGRETLRMFARLRGIYEDDIDGVIDRLAHGLFLSEYIDKQVREYSGGNKRKLSTAVALVGDPPIVFLDEPTTGMDPVARRLLWDVICRIRAAGRSIILTSHSMEECEALCTRLAIMVNGQFKCMGSPQHLKSKFGQGYTLLIKVNISDEEKEEYSKTHRRMTSSSSVRRQTSGSIAPLKRQLSMGSSVQPVKDFVEQNFPGSILKDVHQGLLNYQITDTTISWARIFGMMERSKDKLNIEDYSVGQTTLEQVFLNFAKAQRSEDA